MAIYMAKNRCRFPSFSCQVLKLVLLLLQTLFKCPVLLGVQTHLPPMPQESHNPCCSLGVCSQGDETFMCKCARGLCGCAGVCVHVYEDHITHA